MIQKVCHKNKGEKSQHSPRHTAVQLIKDIAARRAQILLQHNHGSRIQRNLASLQVLHQLRIRQVAHAPLRPDKIVPEPINRLPVLQPMIVDVSNTLFALQARGEFGHGLNDINLIGQRDQQPFGNPSDSARASIKKKERVSQKDQRSLINKSARLSQMS